MIYRPVGPHVSVFFVSILNERQSEIRGSSLTAFGLFVGDLHGRPFGLVFCADSVSDIVIADCLNVACFREEQETMAEMINRGRRQTLASAD